MNTSLWPLRPRSLHAGPCAGKRVIESRVNLSNCPTKHALSLLQFSIHEHQSLPIAPEVFTRRSLHWGARSIHR
ncbi:hypothetical protein ETB91_10415 [Lacticaseibacillus rhamnosus]|nr:hypothetical protein [Lacticaseibacillus rhamnosus]RXS53635.1 hypothetical protein ETB91_10415 [Lacticaseibacillus rhamnosus]